MSHSSTTPHVPGQVAVVSRRQLAVGICTGVLAIAFETIAVATAMPAAAGELDGLRLYGWVFSAFLIGMLFATVVSGRLSDRIGPAKPMMVGLGVFVLGLVGAGTATTMAQLIAGRLVQGLGSGAMNVAVLVLIARVFTPKQRPRMFSYISTAWVLPAFFGPPVSAWLTEHLSWHWVFFAVIPLAAFAAAMMTPTLLRLLRLPGPEPRDTRSSQAPLWAAAVAAMSVVALQLAGQQASAWSLLLVSGGLTGLLVSLPALMPPGFLRLRRGLPAVIAVRGLLPGAFFGAEAFIPLMLVEQRGLSLLLAGAVLTIGTVGWTTGSFVQARPRLSARRDRLITYGCGSVALGIAVVSLAAWRPGWWLGLVAVGWVFAGLGMGLTVASTSLTVMTLSNEANQGQNASSLNLGDALGSGVFVGIAGSVFATLHAGGNSRLTFGVLLLTMATVALLAVVMSLRIGVVRHELARSPDEGSGR